MRQYVDKVASLCYYHLQRLKKVRRVLGPTITSRLVSAFITPTSLSQPSHRCNDRNAAVGIVSNLTTYDKVSASLRELHWLPIRYRITYRLCLMMHNAHVGLSPCYVTEMLTARAPLPTRNRLRSSASTRCELPALRRKIGERAFS